MQDLPGRAPASLPESLQERKSEFVRLGCAKKNRQDDRMQGPLPAGRKTGLG